CREENGALVAEALWVDRFGNVQLNVSPEDVEAYGPRVAVRWGDQVRTARRATTYAELKPGEVGLVLDSYGLLSVALREELAGDTAGSAAGAASGRAAGTAGGAGTAGEAGAACAAGAATGAAGRGTARATGAGERTGVACRTDAGAFGAGAAATWDAAGASV